MKILFITNYYPPCTYDWGYMQLCEEVADGLAMRGHEVAVLTSHYQHGEELKRPYPVYRWLPVDPDWNSDQSAMRQFFGGRLQREQQSVDSLLRVVHEMQPDAIFAWHCVGLSRRMLQTAEQLSSSEMSYYFANYYPELGDEHLRYWEAGAEGFPTGLVKKVVRQVALSQLRREGKPLKLMFPHAVCVSRYVRDRLANQGLIPADSVAIHNGIDLNEFVRQQSLDLQDEKRPIRCLVAGRVDEEKGVHTVVQAFAQLHAHGKTARLRLKILGSGPEAYVQRVKQIVSDNRLEQVVTFVPPVPRDQMPQTLAAHDVLILASEYAEPLARAGQEAMGMGLLVVSTTTGGSGELILHGKTGLAFDAGNANSLAKQLERILNDLPAAEALAEAGYQSVIDHFNIDRTVSEIESYLSTIIVADKQPA